MASSGKKKTTMAKLAREARLRERRLNKQAKKDARKQASSDHLDVTDGRLGGGDASVDPAGPPVLPAAIQPLPACRRTNARTLPQMGPPQVRPDSSSRWTWRGPDARIHPTLAIRAIRTTAQRPPRVQREEAVRRFGRVDHGRSDPREKEVALLRLRDASDEELAVFEGKLQTNALDAGATEREMRHAQRDHPGHGA